MPSAKCSFSKSVVYEVLERVAARFRRPCRIQAKQRMVVPEYQPKEDFRHNSPANGAKPGSGDRNFLFHWNFNIFLVLHRLCQNVSPQWAVTLEHLAERGDTHGLLTLVRLVDAFADQDVLVSYWFSPISRATCCPDGSPRRQPSNRLSCAS